MTTLIFCMLFAQITYSEGSTITLEAPKAFPFEVVTPTPDGFLICNQQDSLVHIFNKQGKLLASLGERDGEEVTLPTTANWLPTKKQFYVYDAATRKFHIWDEQFKHVEDLETDFPSFFEIGPLLEIKDGFVANVALNEDNNLVGRFSDSFDFPRFGYKLVDQELEKLSPVLFRTFVAKADMYNGTKILAAQTLDSNLSILDTNLNVEQTISFSVPGWKRPENKKLKKVSKNPRELEKYASQYSEVIGIQSLGGTLFVVGFRNILGGVGFYFQCYDASTGNALGQTYNTPHKPLGSGFSRIYLRATGGNNMALIPVNIN